MRKDHPLEDDNIRLQKEGKERDGRK